ncbi:hypothetical protein BgiBS90_027746 [Biomphalaria glabrata]|nr:hypothetical protein BgiBS90_027746 [Biomphalaria glabrata]
MWTLLLLIFRLLSVNSQPDSRYEERTGKDLTGNVPKGTCHNNCGNYTTCSCQTNCKTHGTCCKDFREACPSLVRKSQVEFQHFVERIEECEHYHYLLISTCPPEADEQLHPREDQTDQSSIPVSATLQKVINGQGLDTWLFGNTPLTDLDSGFSFRNASIYVCNKLPGKNILFWNIYMEAIELDKQGFLSFESLSKNMSYSLAPLPLTDSSKNTLCINDIEMLQGFKMVPKNTSKFMTPLLNGFESLCSLCDWSYQKSSSVEDIDMKRQELPVMATLEHDKVKFLAQGNKPRKALLWEEIHCPIVKNSERNGSICYIVSCLETFEKISSSRCQNMYILQLAIPHDGRSIGNNFLTKLPNFLECYLNQYSGYNVKNRWPVSELFYDKRSQQVFYATQLVIYSDTLINIWDEAEILGHLSRLAKVMTILKSFRSSVLAKEGHLAQLKEQARTATFDFTFIRKDGVDSLFEDESFIELVCANIIEKESLKFPAFYSRTFLCDYVPIIQNSNVTEEKNYPETNMCLEIFALSGQCKRSSSFIVLINVILYNFLWA